MKKPRKQKLKELSPYVDLHTGQVHEKAFKDVNRLFVKALKKKALDRKIANCERCKGLNIRGITESAPGFGNLNSNIFFLGQSLCTACQFTQMPFTKASGYLVDAALMLSDLDRYDVFITNVVHCHPQKNRTSLKKEKNNCFPFLQQELKIVRPKLLVAMGTDAKNIAERLEFKGKVFGTRHPAAFIYADPQSRVDWVISLSNMLDKYK